MKILIISKNENEGGAARSANRLYKSILNNKEEEEEVNYFVDIKVSDDYNVINLQSKLSKIKRVIKEQYDQIRVRLYTNRFRRVFSPNKTIFTSDLIDKILEINPDIVHFHWINEAMIDVRDLKKIKKPIVWTMHDSWLFTGGCHLPYDCQKYIDKCGACPALGSNKNNDLSYKIFRTKESQFHQIKLTIVTPSTWLRNCCSASKLLKQRKIHVIPNPIDIDVYKPIKKNIAKEIMCLPGNKKILVFGASEATSDVNKGFSQLTEAIYKLNMKNILLIVVGGCRPHNAPPFQYETIYLGRFSDELSMTIAYNCADVVIVPSLSENLSNTIMESLACGVPVVAFDVGGNSDLIEHKLNGYLAKPFDTTDLKDGIEWVLDSSDYQGLCHYSRQKVVHEFASAVISKRYMDLYKEVLDEYSLTSTSH